MFKGQPKGLFALALANTGERFGYYTMLAILALLMQAKFGWTEAQAGNVYAIFLAGVYFMPYFGGILADKIGYGKCVTIGISVMFLGYLSLVFPIADLGVAKYVMFAGLALIAVACSRAICRSSWVTSTTTRNTLRNATPHSAFSIWP